jgi:HTH-type transcriptional regulator/antitoxin HigA
MEEKKMKQKDLLPLFNSEGVVSDILSGRRPITLKTALKLAEFLNVPGELFV